MSIRHMSAGLVLTLILAGCGPEEVSEPQSGHRHPGPQAAKMSDARSVAAELTVLRQATAAFHDFQLAKDAEWEVAIKDDINNTYCFSNTAGAMGIHYAKVGLLDGVVNAAEPEALLYEPQKDGSLRLLGVEYIVPRSAWTGAELPQLFGQTYSYVQQFDVYGLHVWVWRHNPSGMFSPWNPSVSCANAPPVQ